MLPVSIVKTWWPDRVDWVGPSNYWKKWLKAPLPCKFGRHQYDEFEWETNCAGVVYFYCDRCGQQPAWEVPIDDVPGHIKRETLEVLRRSKQNK